MKGFAKLNPRICAIYFLSVLIISMFLRNPVIQIISLVGGILFLSSLSELKEIISDICFYMVLLILITATNLLISHNGETPLFFMNGNPITLESMLYGAQAGVMIISVIIWCKCLSRIITTDKFMYIFSGFAPTLTLILSMALRFIPLLKRQFARVKTAQKTVGIYSQESRADRLKSSMGALSYLTSWSLESAIDTGNAMKARGYGLRPRTHYSIFKFSTADFVIAVLTIAFTALTLISSALGRLDYNFYPSITRIDTSALSIAAYICFLILTLVPYLIETEENLKWKYCISRI